MTKKKLTRETLEAAMREISGAEVWVYPGKYRPFEVEVVTEFFSTMNEVERQRIAIQKLIDHFSDDDLSKVEFIYTNTPKELEEYERLAKEDAAQTA